MKLSILQEKLKEGLGIIERISSKSLTLPILNNVLISTEKNFLNLSATDLEIGINWWSLSKNEKEGKITVSSRLLSNFVSLLPNRKIDIAVENNTLELGCENYKTQIKGLSADDFPIIPKITEGEFVFVNNKNLCQGLSHIADIAIPSTIKPEISGIYFLFQKNQITLVATDSFRLGEKKVFLKNSSSLKKDYSFILPQKTAKEIISILGDKEGDSKIYFSPNQIMIELQMEDVDHPQVQIISRLIEGEYPNYQDIIPEKHKTQLVLDKSEFLNQIKSASLFSGKANEIKLKVDSKKKQIDVFSKSQDIGEYQSLIPSKIKGEDVEIAFNYKFLADGVANIKTAEIVLDFNGDSGPGVLRPAGDQTYLYVVMPIKAS